MDRRTLLQSLLALPAAIVAVRKRTPALPAPPSPAAAPTTVTEPFNDGWGCIVDVLADCEVKRGQVVYATAGGAVTTQASSTPAVGIATADSFGGAVTIRSPVWIVDS